MSSRRSRSSRQSGGRGITDDQIADILNKLHQLLPRTISPSNKASTNRVLEETCNYIRSLNKEVDDLSERLSELLSSTDGDSAQAAIIRSLLM